MPNPVSDFFDKYFGLHFVERLKQQVVGLCEDFWVDGSENLLGLDYDNFSVTKIKELLKAKKVKNSSAQASSPSTTKKTAQPSAAVVAKRQNLWHAAPGEISEKMWGEGFVTPGDGTINSLLISPLGLTKEMSVLDLSAGLGGRVRKATQETGAYITGLEPDASIAERGMQLSVRAGKSKQASIASYDPAKLVLTRSYDGIIARETFYRAPDRPGLFAVIAKNSKPHAQIAFTDYVLDPEHQGHPAIVAWKQNEVLANPCGLVEMAELWAKVGFGLRIHEDLSEFYKKEVMAGMARLMQFLGSGITPDPETGKAVLRRVETWKHRIKAMEAGMKFYRFYGTKM